MAQRRRGRPRCYREKIDQGTAELQHKRQQLLEKRIDKNMALAESLLGVLYARNFISPSLYDAGRSFEEIGYKYSFCQEYAFRPRVNVLNLESGNCWQDRDSRLSEDEEEKRTKAWRNALNILQQAGHRSYQVVLKVVFYNQDLYARSSTALPLEDMRALKRGLNHLDKYFKGELKDGRGKPHGSVQNPVQSTRSPPFLKELPPLFPPQRLVLEHRGL